MSFRPIIPMAGYNGWRFLQRTMPSQREAFDKSPLITRDLTYFKEKIGEVKSASDLVKDRRLLRVSLTAFGLEGDLNNSFFVEKILAEGSKDPKALANKLGDKRYAAMSKAFGFDNFGLPNTALSGFAKDVVQRYKDKSFEASVGAVDGNMRLALNLKQGIGDIVKAGGSPQSHWFKVMGTPPLRAVFEKALGLPSSIGKLDLDQQLNQFKSRAKKVFGTDVLAEFAQPELREKLAEKFFLRSQLDSFSAKNSSAQTALMLLSQIQIPKYTLY